MSDNTRLLDLVVRWEELREAGQILAIEELCRTALNSCRRCDSGFRDSVL
jgi:hypothetical protein